VKIHLLKFNDPAFKPNLKYQKLNRAFIKLLYVFVCFMATACYARQHTDFVTIKGTQMVLNNRPYNYVGTNYWYGVLLEAVNGEQGKQRLKTELDFMKSKGITNLRVFAGAEGKANSPFRVPYAIQPEQGKVDAKYLESLDYFLNEIGKRDMKAVVFLTNNWDWSGGLTQYLKWNGYGDAPVPQGYGSANTSDGKNWWDEVRKYTTQFYNCPSCQTALNNYITTILTHKNTINGKNYTDDPAIMAWEIANEPRPMMMDNIKAFQTWISNTAAHIKSIDKNHLLTTGSEGDIAYDNHMDAYTATHQDKNIDYLTIHIWPKNWGWFKDTAIVQSFPQILANTSAYIDRHIKVAVVLNKPIVIEEFGLPRDKHLFAQSATTISRDKYYKHILNYFQQSAKDAGVIAGVNFWGMGGYAKNHPEGKIWKPGDDFTCDPGQEEQGLNSVFAGDVSTWKIIAERAGSIAHN